MARARRKPFHADKLYLLGFTELPRRKKPGLKKGWPSGHQAQPIEPTLFLSSLYGLEIIKLTDTQAKVTPDPRKEEMG